MNHVIVGGSSGLGHSLATMLPGTSDTLYLVNRSMPPSLDFDDGVKRIWVKADVSKPEFVDELKTVIDVESIDSMIFCAGIWDSSHDPLGVTPKEIYQILSVNTAAYIATVTCLYDKLVKSNTAKIVAIGSIAGLDNYSGQNLGYIASKFGLRGATHGLRNWFRDSTVSATTISVGSMTSDPSDNSRIHHSDIANLIKAIFAMDSSSVVKDITMPANSDRSI